MRLRGLEPTKKRTLLPFFPKHLIYAIHALLDLAALLRIEEDRIPESFFAGDRRTCVKQTRTKKRKRNLSERFELLIEFIANLVSSLYKQSFIPFTKYAISELH